MGWDVVATDTPQIVDAVLRRNIAHNIAELPPGSGTVQARALDWTVPPEQWTWDNPRSIASCAETEANTASQTASVGSASEGGGEHTLLGPPFDLIITADTIYSPALTGPLLRTLKALCQQSIAQGTKSSRTPPIYLCLERRDPALVDQVLADAAKDWTVKRVPHSKLSHAMEKGGLSWEKSEWEDVEVWTFTHLRG